MFVTAGFNFIILWSFHEKQIYVQGQNRFGQLGVGINDTNHQPIFIPIDLSNRLENDSIKQVVASPSHVAILTANGNMLLAGHNGHGQLAMGNKTNAFKTFAKMAYGPATQYFNVAKIAELAVGESFTFCRDANGQLFATGDNREGQLGLPGMTGTSHCEAVPLPLHIRKIVAGYQHSVALMPNRSVSVCGRNDFGQLGMNHVNSLDTFTASSSLQAPLLPIHEFIVDIAAGGDSTFVLTSEGRVLACGNNQNGQLGLGDKANRLVFTAVDLSGVLREGEKIERIIAGTWRTILMTSEKRILTCGSDLYQEGQQHTTFQAMDCAWLHPGTTITDIALGCGCSAFVASDNSIRVNNQGTSIQIEARHPVKLVETSLVKSFETSLESSQTLPSLPVEMWRQIFSYLSISDIMQAAQTCKELWNIAIESRVRSLYPQQFLSVAQVIPQIQAIYAHLPAAQQKTFREKLKMLLARKLYDSPQLSQTISQQTIAL